MCGGTAGQPSNEIQIMGLSPRVRGNRQRAAHIQPCGGSIPACAGEPVGEREPTRRKAVYPRVCGGTAVRRRDCVVERGLSPRVRGNLWFRCQ